jgi:VanZ family protein
MISRINWWVVAAVVWISIIFFSSTAIAGRWSVQALTFLTVHWFRPLVHLPSFYWSLIAEKSVHVCLFLVLAVLLCKALPKELRKLHYLLLVGLVIGSASEFLQRFFPGRDPAIRDVCINFTGTAIGVAISLVFHQLRKNSKEGILL